MRVHKDETGVIRYVDEMTTQVLGWRPEDMMGHRSLEFIHPQDHDAALSSWVRLIVAPGSRQSARVRHNDSAERWIWMDVTNHNLLNDPKYRIVITEMVPAADDAPAEEPNWASSQLLRRLTETLPLGVLQIDQSRRIVFRNERLHTIVGAATARTVEEEFHGVVPADRQALDAALLAVLSGPDRDIEVSLVHPDLGLRRCDIRLRALTDRMGTQVTGAILCVIDVTEEARRREEVEHRASYDGLTQCLNRISILSSLVDVLAGCGTLGDDSGVAVIFIDLDRFKPINDEYGHAAGDRLLQLIADRLRAGARDSDFIGRTGGDEFLIVCPAVESADAALCIGDRVTTAVRQPADLGEFALVPSCSMGIAWTRNRDDDIATLVARADSAMYESKRAGDSQPVLAAQ
jgi:diguanylate cyclase (GGDEF)-like protein